MAGISSCYPPSIPLKQGKAENNETYKISYSLQKQNGVRELQLKKVQETNNYQEQQHQHKKHKQKKSKEQQREEKH